MSFNVQVGVPGPQGPPGGAGTTGPTGPTGAPGSTQTLITSFLGSFATFATLQAQYPSGQIPTGTYPLAYTVDSGFALWNGTAWGLSATPNLLPIVTNFTNLPAPSLWNGFVAITTDQGLQFSNGIVWTAIDAPASVPVLAGTFTYATLPPAVANPNLYAATTDQGAVYSNGATWLLLYNPTNATVGISTNTPLPSAVTGTAYTATINATNGAPPYTWSIVSRFVSANAWAINSSTGVISLTPSTAETDAFMVQVSDSTGATTQKLFSITVTGSAPTAAATPTFTPAAGSYSVSQTITIACATAGASIFYTTNGSTPTTSSTPYTAPIMINTTSTVQAIAIAAGYTQSAVGSAAYTINTAGAVYKFNPGDYAIVPQYGITNEASTSNDLTWIKTLVSHPAKGFVMQRQWADLDQGSAIDNNPAHAVAGTGNFTGFTTQIGAVFNLLQTYCPGTHLGIFINTIQIWGSPIAGSAPTNNCSVPNYILNCGGSITIANSFGSGSSTNYTLYKYSGGYCGIGFYGYNSPAAGDYGFLMNAWWDPACVQAICNMIQALALYQLPTATAYLSGTTYGLGALVSSGGSIYCSIQAGNTGNAVTNTTWWKISSNNYAGQTLNQCGLIEYFGNNDETSATFNQGPATPGNTSSANVCSYQNYYAGYFKFLQQKKTSFPNTMGGGCFTFVITGTTGEQDAGTWTGYLATLNASQGIAFTQADIFVNTFTPGSAHPSGAMLAYIGLNPDGSYAGTLPAFGSFSANYVGVMPAVIQVEPEDYTVYTGTSSATTANVNKLITSMTYVQTTHRLWSVQDNTFAYSVYGATIQPAFTAGTQAYGTPTNQPNYRPSNLP
jgi:hypothetical protein